MCDTTASINLGAKGGLTWKLPLRGRKSKKLPRLPKGPSTSASKEAIEVWLPIAAEEEEEEEEEEAEAGRIGGGPKAEQKES